MTEPLTPPDCDLRDYPWMPLDVLRLRDSTIASVESAEAFRCAVLLWCAAWHQIPAASLPDDETQIARLAGYGRDVKTFRNVRPIAMRGWLTCSDGRLYHPVVAEKARESWDKKLAQKARTEAARRAKAERKAAVTTEPQTPPKPSVTESVTEPVTRPVARLVTATVTTSVTGSTGEDRTGQEILKEERTPPSLRSGHPPPAGSRLPDAWQPSDDDVVFATALRLDHTAVAAKFRDYWHAKAGREARKTDWSATWRNWCRRDAEAKPQARASPQNARKSASDAAMRQFFASRDEPDFEMPRLQ